MSCLFSHVSVGDAFLGGILIGHEKFHYYQCCVTCTKKNFLPDKPTGQKVFCKFCGSKVDQSQEAHDFSVNLVISDNNGDDMFTVLAFRRHLGYEFNTLTAAAVEADMQQKLLSRVSVEYDKEDSEGKSVITAQAVKFPIDTE